VAYPPNTGTTKSAGQTITSAAENVQKAALDDIVTEVGSTVPRNYSRRRGAVDLDDFTGATDDLKLTAALSYAGAQTKPPTICFADRTHTFTVQGRRPYEGMHLTGPYGQPGREAVSSNQGRRHCDLVLNMNAASGANANIGWFHPLTTAEAWACGFENFTLRWAGADGSGPVFLSAPGGVVWWLTVIRNIASNGLWGVIGSHAQICAIDGVSYTGVWNINNCQSTAFHFGGSDNELWTEGFLLIDSEKTRPAFAYHMWFHSMEKTNVGSIYATCDGDFPGCLITGPANDSGNTSNQGGPINFRNTRFEGRNEGDPCFGSVVRQQGGITTWSQCWFAYAMSNTGLATNPVPAGFGTSSTPAGAYHIAGGRASFSQCAYDRTSGQSNTIPFIYANGGGVTTRVQVSDVTAASKGGTWGATLPRVRALSGAVVNYGQGSDGSFELVTV
jgi:hypothetical protein